MTATLRAAVILAAGRGRRMWPYDELRPKAAIPIMNRPLIARLVDDLAAAGIDRVVVVIGHQGQRVRHSLAGRANVRYVRQDDTAAGTAPALLAALPWVEDDAFLVLHGDLLVTRTDLQALIAAFAAGDAPLTALVAPLGREDSRDWICADVRGDALVAVEGHARSGEYRLCGVYAMRRAALPAIEANPGILEQVPVGGMPPAEADLAASLTPLLDAGHPIPAVVAAGPFVDLDKPWHILEANERAVDLAALELGDGVTAAEGASISDAADIRGPVFLEAGASIGPRTLVEGPLWVGAGARLDNGPIIGPRVVIGPHCRIANYCQLGAGTVVGAYNVVDHCAELSGVTMDRVYLSHYMEFWGVIGSATDLGAATVCGNLRFDDGETVHRVLGRREVPRIGANACYLGDYCRTGVNAILMPGVKIGPYCCIGPGVVVYEDVPARTLLMARQELVRTAWGPERYGW